MTVGAPQDDRSERRSARACAIGQRRERRPRRVAGLLALVLVGCGAEIEGVPVGALARVGDEILEPKDLETRQLQLGAYAQRRFSGPEGRRSLLEGVIQQMLIRVEAKAQGLDRHPALDLAVWEEIGRLQLLAEMERRVPVSEVAADEAALRAYYDAHLGEFMLPEERRVALIGFSDVTEAYAALDAIEAGRSTFDDIAETEGGASETELMRRADADQPGFHRFIFDPSLDAGDVVGHPVYVNEKACVARISEVQAAAPQPFGDLEVQERLINAVRAPRVEAASAALLADLEARYPLEPAP